MSNDGNTKTDVYEEDAEIKFVVLSFPIIIIIGTICNILTFLVMRRQRMKSQSTGFYMAVLAVADELALLIGCTSYWLYEFKKITILHTHTVVCQSFSVLLYSTMDFSVWMVVVLTLERFIAVYAPLKSKSILTVGKARIVTTILAFVIFIINSHFLFTHSLLERTIGDGKGCQSKSQTFDFFMGAIWPWIDAGKYSFVPLLTIIILNVLIIYNLIVASQVRNTMSTFKKKKTSVQQINSSSSGGGASAQQQQQQTVSNRRLTIMLLVVSISFCILSAPLVILQILEQTKIVKPSKLIQEIFLMLQYSNHSINFFLYVITGKVFRKEFIALLQCSDSNTNYKKYQTMTNRYTELNRLSNAKNEGLNQRSSINSKRNTLTAS